MKKTEHLKFMRAQHFIIAIPSFAHHSGGKVLPALKNGEISSIFGLSNIEAGRRKRLKPDNNPHLMEYQPNAPYARNENTAREPHVAECKTGDRGRCFG